MYVLEKENVFSTVGFSLACDFRGLWSGLRLFATGYACQAILSL